jgi:hypothetical protein
MQQRKTPSRTNSLAFAKSDCHTCKTKRRNCDRQRPVCSTCQDLGDKCEGFQTRLVWEGSDLPSRRGDDSRRRHGLEARGRTTESPMSPANEARVTKVASTARRPTREFAFVPSWPPKPRKKHTRKNVDMARQVQEGPSPIASTIDHINRHGTFHKAMREDLNPTASTPGHGEADQPTPSMIDASAMTPALNGIDSYAGWDVEDADEEVLPPGPSSALYDWSVDNEMHETFSTGWSALVNETLSPAAIALSLNSDQLQSFYSIGFDFMTSIPPAVQYSATADQFSLLLDRCKSCSRPCMPESGCLPESRRSGILHIPNHKRLGHQSFQIP